MTESTAESKPSVHPARSVGLHQTFASLRLRNYRVFWMGMLAAALSMHMEIVVRGWVVYEMSDKALILGLVGFVWGVPQIILSPFAGVVLDRMDRRAILVATQVALFLTHLLISVLLATHSIQVWHFVAVSFLTGFIFAFNMPGRQTIISDLVEEKDLLNAIALNSSAVQFARVVGPAVGGALLGFIGGAGAYFVMTGLYAVVVVFLLLLDIPDRAGPRREMRLMRDLGEGVSYVRRSPAILALMAMAFVPVIFGMPYQSLLPVLAVDVLAVGEFQLGILMTMVGVGALVGSLGVAALANLPRRGMLLLAMATGFGLALLLLSLAGSYHRALPVLLLIGVTSSGYMALNQALIQGHAPPHLRGRVVSLYMTTWGLMPMATLPAGALVDAVGIAPTFALGGGVVAVYALGTALAQPTLRRLR